MRERESQSMCNAAKNAPSSLALIDLGVQLDSVFLQARLLDLLLSALPLVHLAGVLHVHQHRLLRLQLSAVKALQLVSRLLGSTLQQNLHFLLALQSLRLLSLALVALLQVKKDDTERRRVRL